MTTINITIDDIFRLVTTSEGFIQNVGSANALIFVGDDAPTISNNHDAIVLESKEFITLGQDNVTIKNIYARVDAEGLGGSLSISLVNEPIVWILETGLWDATGVWTTDGLWNAGV